VPTGDGGSVEELLADNEESARLGLLDLGAERAPSMLRAFTHVVSAAAVLWEVTSPPDSIDPLVPDPMAQLREIGSAIHRDYSSGRWPGVGVLDERVMRIALNLDQAGLTLLAVPSAERLPDAGPGVADRSVALRQRVIHTLYVEAHGLRVALGRYAADVTHQLQRDHLRRTQGAAAPPRRTGRSAGDR